MTRAFTRRPRHIRRAPSAAVSAWFVAACLSASVGGAARAQDEPPLALGAETIAFSLAGHRLVLPRPDWLADDAEPMRFHRRFSEQIELLELIPPGENFEDWRHMIAVLAVADPAYGVAQHEASIAGAFAQNCDPETLALQKLPPLAEGAPQVLFAVCGAYGRQTEVTRTGLGEILIAVVLTTDTGSAKFYQEWQGRAFDIRDPASWPVSQDDLYVAAERLQRLAAFAPVAGD